MLGITRASKFKPAVPFIFVQICGGDISSLHVTMISSRCSREWFEEPVTGCLWDSFSPFWEKRWWRWRLRIRKIGERSLLAHVSRQAGSESALVEFSVVVRIDLRYLEMVHVHRRLSIFAELLESARRKERKDYLSRTCILFICILGNRVGMEQRDRWWLKEQKFVYKFSATLRRLMQYWRMIFLFS